MKLTTAAAVLAAGAALAAAGCETLPNLPPTASFVFNPAAPIVAGQTTVAFNASASRDADGTISRYVWDFGDGTPQVTAATATTTHVFPRVAAVPTTYTVLLTVVDDVGDRGSASQNVVVSP